MDGQILTVPGGTHWEYNNLVDLQTAAPELLQENTFPLPLPRSAVVFTMHQGYAFDFFVAAEGDDPPMYADSEGRAQVEFNDDGASFSRWVRAQVAHYVQYSFPQKEPY